MRECTLAMRKSCKIWSACSLAYGGGEDLPPCIKESPSTDAQQLKAEIAALATRVETSYTVETPLEELSAIVYEMRQLSAF